MTDCASCGGAIEDEQYCPRCGAQTPRSAAMPPPPPPPPSGVSQEPGTPPSEPGRRRSVAPLALGVAALLVAAGVGGYFLLRPAGGAASSGTAPAPPTSQSSAGDTDLAGDRPTATPAAGAADGPVSAGSTLARTTTSGGAARYEPVPTGATADCAAPDAVDAAGVKQTYEPAKAFDGQRQTAWRCSGDASGKSLVISFGAPVELTSVGLIPGYDKIDGTDASDRFVQSRKITRVRWTFDDGTSVDSTPNGDRSMQITPVSVRTGTVRMTIEQTTPGSTITNNKGESLAALDTTAVSEIAFTGVH